jgi:hypothetical protein
MFVGNRARPVRRADTLTPICEPIIYTSRILNISQTFRSPRPVTGITLLFLLVVADPCTESRRSRSVYLNLMETSSHGVVMKGYVLLGVTPCRLVRVDRRFGGTFRSLQARRIRQKPARVCVLLGLFFGSEDEGDMFL